MSSIRRRRKESAVDQRLSTWTRRRVLCWSLFALAAVIAVQHLVAHAGFRPIPLSMGWQDVLVGYPMAIALAIVGGMMLDPHPRK